MNRPVPRGRTASVDHVKALVLERIHTLRLPAQDCAAAMGVSLSTWYARLRQPSAQWLLGELLPLSAYLGIGDEELDGAIRRERNAKHETL